MAGDKALKTSVRLADLEDQVKSQGRALSLLSIAVILLALSVVLKKGTPPVG